MKVDDLGDPNEDPLRLKLPVGRLEDLEPPPLIPPKDRDLPPKDPPDMLRLPPENPPKDRLPPPNEPRRWANDSMGTSKTATKSNAARRRTITGFRFITYSPRLQERKGFGIAAANTVTLEQTHVALNDVLV